MKRTLLEGGIRRQLIALALPLLIGTLLQQLYNTVDSLIIGHFLGTRAFSAAGVAGTVMNLLIFVISGFCTGVSLLFSRMYGSGDRQAFRREVFISASLGGLVTLTLMALFTILMRPILQLIHTPAELVGLVESYLRVIIGGLLCTFLYNLCSNMLNSIGDTRAGTFFLFVAVLVNAAADYLFVGVLGMGVAGAAWATVLSQLLSALCCLAYIFRRDRELICTRRDMIFDRGMVKRTLGFGFSSALNMSSLFIGKLLVQGAVNLLGTPGIAGYAAAMRIEDFANSFGTSTGSALAVFISQNWGAGNRKRVRQGLVKGMQLNIALGLTLSVLLALLARRGVGMFLDADEAGALAYGVSYLQQVALFYVLCFVGNAFIGYIRGVGQMKSLVFATTIQIGLRALLSHLWVGTLGLRAVALATGFGWILMNSYYLFRVLYLEKSKRFEGE